MEDGEDIYELMAGLRREARRFAVVTVARVEGSVPRGAGAKMIVTEDGSCHGTIGGGELERLAVSDALKAIRHGEGRMASHVLEESGDTGMACGGNVEIMIEVPKVEPLLYIIGGGHIALALYRLARMVGFKAIVVEHREEFCNEERFPDAELIRCEVEEAVKHVQERVDGSSFVVIVTHGHRNDQAFLEAVVDRGPRYLGVIGSHKKLDASYAKLRELGVEDARLREVHAPIGLDIGSDTPEEIAVAIMAEMIKTRSGKGDGSELREGYWSTSSDE